MTGVDYLKLDFCGMEKVPTAERQPERRYSVMRDSLNATLKADLLSSLIVPSANPSAATCEEEARQAAVAKIEEMLDAAVQSTEQWAATASVVSVVIIYSACLS